MKYIKVFENFEAPEKNYYRDQPRLFDLDIKDKEYSRYKSGKYGDAMNYITQNHDELVSTPVIYVIEELKKETGYDFTEDEVMDMFDFYITNQTEIIEADKKEKERKIQHAIASVSEFAKKIEVEPSYKGEGSGLYFENETLNTLYNYLIGEGDIEDAVYLTGLDRHELELMKLGGISDI